jgi:hypothetical protein
MTFTRIEKVALAVAFTLFGASAVIFMQLMVR